MDDGCTVTPLLSVIVPTYNYGSMIERALSSVLNQMDERSELIVIDDGSTDDTQEALARIDIPGGVACCFIHQENAGPAAARNHGLHLSRGRFLLFLDADDELLPGALNAVLTSLHNAQQRGEEPGMVLGAHIAVYQTGREKFDKATPVSGTPYQRIKDYLFSSRISVCHGASLFRRDLLEQRPYPEHIRQGEDKPVFAYFIAHAEVMTLDVALARIYKHPGSLRRNTELAQTSREALLEAVFEKLPPECQTLKPRYAAKQFLSVFRNCYRAGQYRLARRYFDRAWQANWRQSLQWPYLSKYLRLRFKRWQRRK